MKDIIGIIYPLPEKVLNYMFSNKKDIFVKYLTHNYTRKSKLKLNKHMKLLFYQSGGNKEIIGEADIKKIEHMKIDEVKKKYMDRLMAPLKNITIYSQGREDKTLIVIHLQNLKKFIIPVKCRKRITMTGQYITRSMITKGIFEGYHGKENGNDQ